MSTHRPSASPGTGLARRSVLGWLAAGVAMPVIAGCGSEAVAAREYPVHYPDAEWKRRLAPAAYAVLRQSATEAPYTSPLLNEHRKGTFTCAADGNPLFASATKFDSHTGWPSFWQVLPHATGSTTDYAIGIPRTAIHCARCGGHLGHVFDDGPPPTGKRYCMNGAALSFLPS